MGCLTFANSLDDTNIVEDRTASQIVRVDPGWELPDKVELL